MPRRSDNADFLDSSDFVTMAFKSLRHQRFAVPVVEQKVLGYPMFPVKPIH